MPTHDADGLILQHNEDAPAALFADWLDERGISYAVHGAWERPLPEDARRYRWVCSLGSEHTPGRAPSPPWVDAEIDFLRDALDAEVPVLGLCFGGQALAAAAGAAVAPADPPEVGWIEIETDDPARIPAGPWLHFHYDQLSLPDGASELARSPAGTAAYELGPHLGLQFHPEVTPEIAAAWARSEGATLRRLGMSAEQLAAIARHGLEDARRDAGRLFDGWWRRLPPPR